MLPYFRFHHIGIATPSIEKTSKFYVEAGYAMSDPVIDEVQDIRIAFLSKEGMPTIELLEPIDDRSPVNNTLKKNGVQPYHCCYIVSNIEKAIQDLRAKRFIPLSKPVNAVALNNHMICFLYNKQVGLIELVEE